jgi:broad specificity phosphatase PhoE
MGKEQAASLAHEIPKIQEEIDLVVSSPLKRTLQTTKLGWAPAIERLGGLSTVVCLPQAQECDGWPCDTGSSKETLLADPEFADFDLSLLTPDWNSKQGFYGIDRFSLDKRARWVRQFLRDRPETNIVLVAHGDFLRMITRGPEQFSTYKWKNAECRVFTFDPEWGESEQCYLREEKVAFDGWEGLN